MSKYRLILLLVLIVNQFCFSQQPFISRDNADCYNAIELLSDSFGPVNPPVGYGKIMEIHSGKSNPIFFEKEHNTVWYKFTVKNNCVLTFDIIPINKKDDYDFMLYRSANENFCEELMTKEIHPVRTNIAKSSDIKNGWTGLSVYASDTFVRSGLGPTSSRALEVGKGEIYYLVVDNASKNGKGHTLILHYQYCSKAQSILVDHHGYFENYTIDDLESDSITELKKPKSILHISINDKQTHQPIIATVDIINFKTLKLVDKDFHMEGLSKFDKEVIQGRKYIIQCNADGYFPAVKERLIKEKEIDITVLLEKIEAGKNIAMDNIYFYGNTDKFTASSIPALKNLVNLLKVNRTMKLKIDGHVNWPKKYATEQEEKFNLDLSFNRAKAVYDYLIKSGINPKRLDYEGFGNTRMVYPHPANEQESQMNRRVEIEIISN